MSDLKLPPGREPLTSDWFAEQLGRSQQKVMSLTVENRALKTQLEKKNQMADVLKSLLMDIVIDLRGNVLKTAIQERIRKTMQRLDDEAR